MWNENTGFLNCLFLYRACKVSWTPIFQPLWFPTGRLKLWAVLRCKISLLAWLVKRHMEIILAAKPLPPYLRRSSAVLIPNKMAAEALSWPDTLGAFSGHSALIPGYFHRRLKKKSLDSPHNCSQAARHIARYLYFCTLMKQLASHNLMSVYQTVGALNCPLLRFAP